MAKRVVSGSSLNVANSLSAVPLCLNIYPGDGASTDEGFLEWVLSLFIAQMRLIIENEMAINLRTPGSLALVSTVALSGIVT